jgi:hypothetical protein
MDKTNSKRKDYPGYHRWPLLSKQILPGKGFQDSGVQGFMGLKV